MVKRNNSFDARMDRTNTWIGRGVIAVFCFVAIVFTIIIGVWSFIGYTAIKVVNNPEAAGAAAGSFVGDAIKGFKESQSQQ